MPFGYLQLPSWTVLSTIPTVGQGEAVSRYSVGIADWSGLSLRRALGGRLMRLPTARTIGRVGSASLPLTLILYHTLRQKSIGFEKFFMNFLYFLYEQIMNCGIGIYGAPFKQL